MKYIIDVDKDRLDCSGQLFIAVDIPNSQSAYEIPTGIWVKDYTETDRKAIEDEVWAFAKEILCISEDCGATMGDSYSEAKAKYEAWKKQKAEIRVGDEVKEKTALWTGVIVGFDEFGDLTIMDRSGNSCGGYKAKYFKKTGRHFDEVEELLKKMGDEK